jgi:hypothetical protein
MARKKEEWEKSRLSNFISNIKYYCEYNRIEIPDSAFVEREWKAGVPLDEVVDKWLVSRRKKRILDT